jgi:DNA polymerase (family 10)
VQRGYDYIAITDHAEDLPRFGVDKKRMQAQRDDIERARENHPGITILHGVELNIGPDGELDWDPEFRAWFDFCLAGVHSHFDQPQARQTERILRAMDDPTVTAIGHLTGRMIGRRKGIELDIDAVL